MVLRRPGETIPSEENSTKRSRRKKVKRGKGKKEDWGGGKKHLERTNRD